MYKAVANIWYNLILNLNSIQTPSHEIFYEPILATEAHSFRYLASQIVLHNLKHGCSYIFSNILHCQFLYRVCLKSRFKTFFFEIVDNRSTKGKTRNGNPLLFSKHCLWGSDPICVSNLFDSFLWHYAWTKFNYSAKQSCRY